MTLPDDLSRHNYFSFLWHAVFLALAQNFMDVDTVIPAMLVEAGGGAVHVGLMTAIMLGGSAFTQLLFAPFVSNYPFKKKILLLGINLRIISLMGLGAMLFFLSKIGGACIIYLVFLFITLFSLSGAFANISYTDILGKSINPDNRKSFFSIKQAITGTVVFFSAFLAKKILTASAFPINYAAMFLVGFLSLFVASLGFWRLKETIPAKLPMNNIRQFFSTVKTELNENKKLKYFIGFVNTQGITISLLPFIVLYAKEFYATQSSDTGKFLLFKVIGSVAAGISIYLLGKKVRYNFLLYGNAILSLVVPCSLSIKLIVKNRRIPVSAPLFQNPPKNVKLQSPS